MIPMTSGLIRRAWSRDKPLATCSLRSQCGRHGGFVLPARESLGGEVVPEPRCLFNQVGASEWPAATVDQWLHQADRQCGMPSMPSALPSAAGDDGALTN